MDILSETLSALEREPRVLLATIIATDGSTPASALSKMLVTRGGASSVGTVGGGCMEGDVILHANRIFDSGRAEIVTFRLNEDHVEEGLICGGTLEVLIEPITRDDLPLLQQIKHSRDDGKDSVLARVLSPDGDVRCKKLFTGEPDSWTAEAMQLLECMLRAQADDSPTQNSSVTPILRDSIIDALRRSLHRQESIQLPTFGETIILEPILGTPTLIVFGGGHVSRYLSRAATLVGFRTTIVDDREKFANPQRFPEAVQTIVADFLDAFNRITISPSSYVVIVTRGHRHDEAVLERALSTPAGYIGMIGSKRKVLTAFEHLASRGVTKDSLRRVHAPIGIEIGAVTAEEIAISIVAELIRVRRGTDQPLQHKSLGVPLQEPGQETEE
jgi:xanthine dehydrogenase accessory factor